MRAASARWALMWLVPAVSIAWAESDIEQAEALSKKTGRPILAVMGTDT